MVRHQSEDRMKERRLTRDGVIQAAFRFFLQYSVVYSTPKHFLAILRVLSGSVAAAR